MNDINPRDPTIPFTAHYPGTCTACKHTYPKGATIRKRDGLLYHAGCSKPTVCTHRAIVDHDTTTVRCLECKTRLPK